MGSPKKVFGVAGWWAALDMGYLSQGGICPLVVSRDSFPTCKVWVFWAFSGYKARPLPQHRWAAKLNTGRFFCLTYLIHPASGLVKKAALEKSLVSGRFMAHCADCTSVARLVIYNYICAILMAPGVWFGKTIKCILASVSVREAVRADRVCGAALGTRDTHLSVEIGVIALFHRQ